jgi:multicomponent Na+:H+ antiporter subunit A
MITAILVGFVGALAAPLIHRVVKSRGSALISLLPLGLFVYFAQMVPSVAAGVLPRENLDWVPELGMRLTFRMDGLGLLFALLITGIGTLVVFYAAGYMKEYERQGRFYLFLLSFLSSMLGLVLADNLLTLFLFWEMTSITSYLLIGFDHQKAESRSAALQAFLVTGGGGLALLGGLLLLGTAAGTFDVSEMVGASGVLANHPYYLPALALILLGAFTKSAQFPFHFWLPNAMAAPTPVSAYLHSATMVKAGVYLLARLYPIYAESAWWQGAVTGVGLVTMLVGAFLALNNSDLKRILAYSTISSLGTMTMLLGIGADAAVKAAIVFLLAHALYKGALFMLAGAIDHETGTRDVDRLGGLRTSMPLLAAFSVVAAFSLAGLGPLLSFIGKELLFEASLAAPGFWWILPVAVLSSAVSVALALIVTVRPFWGAPKAPQPQGEGAHGAHGAHHGAPHDPPVTFWLGPAVLGLLGLVMGLFPNFVSKYLAQPAVAATLSRSYEVKLALWHGLNAALGMSALAIAGGVLLYFGWETWRRQMGRLEPALRWGPEAGYGWSIVLLNKFAEVQTRVLQNGYLRFYLLTIILVTVFLAGSLLLQGGLYWPEQITEILYYEAALAILIILAALTAVRSQSRLGAITAMGVVGYGIALIFLQFGAPDLAMTQFLIESITVVLFVFAFYHLPRFNPLSPPGPRLVHATVAVLVGLLMAGLTLSAVRVNLFPSISEFFLENAVPLAHGRNIVNVILVDFRGIDTLGEITVLAVAAAGVYAVLKYRKKERT